MAAATSASAATDLADPGDEPLPEPEPAEAAPVAALPGGRRDKPDSQAEPEFANLNLNPGTQAQAQAAGHR